MKSTFIVNKKTKTQVRLAFIDRVINRSRTQMRATYLRKKLMGLRKEELLEKTRMTECGPTPKIGYLVQKTITDLENYLRT